MSPLVYITLGVVAGGLLGILAVVVWRWQDRRGIAINARTVEEELIKRLEMIDRGLRDEFSRNREEAGTAAKTQREELGKSLEGVRGIVA
jgi:uncharacterized protein involved in exopolysaccharide biosynthesis